MFGRREVNPEKILRMNGDQWRQGDVLRVTPRRRWDGDPEAKRMVMRRRDFGEVALSPMRWGLVPETTHEDEPARPLISVRAETIAEHIEWRRLLNAKRCVVPAEQFFEWMRVGDVKTKEFVFRYKSRRPMMIAALWSRSPSPAVRPAECFAYISCPANRLIGQIHDRMPVILDDAGVTAWLNPDAPLETLIDLMRPVENGMLELNAVPQQLARVRPYQPSLFASRAA
jgi:putative SOS response-associated peptidase YedK